MNGERRQARYRWAVLGAAIALVATACAGGHATPTTAPAAAPARPSSTVAPGEPLPAVSLAMFDGSVTSFDEYRGRPLVINFWASWCPSCVAEMSAAIRPAQDAVGDEVAFLGVNLQDERGAAERLVNDTGVKFDLAEDPKGDLYLALGGLGMPFTAFVDRTGAIVHRHDGPLTEQQLLDLIDEFLLS